MAQWCVDRHRLDRDRHRTRCCGRDAVCWPPSSWCWAEAWCGVQGRTSGRTVRGGQGPGGTQHGARGWAWPRRSGRPSRQAEHDLRERGEGGTQSPMRLAWAGNGVLISGLRLREGHWPEQGGSCLQTLNSSSSETRAYVTGFRAEPITELEVPNTFISQLPRLRWDWAALKGVRSPLRNGEEQRLRTQNLHKQLLLSPHLPVF